MSAVSQYQSNDTIDWNHANKKSETKMTDDEMTDLLAKYAFANSELMIQFQQKLHCKTVDFICDVLRLIWEDEILFFSIPVLMWMFQGKVGLTIAVVCGYSEVLNIYLKCMIQKPRPFWVIKGLQNLGQSFPCDEYSLPSGHTQFSFTWSFAIIHTSYNVLPSYVICALIIFPTLTALSRVYLGVHSFECVISGSIIGMLFATTMCHIFPPLLVWCEGLPVTEGMLFVLFATFIIPYFGFFLILKVFTSPSADIIERWTRTALRNTYSYSQLQNIHQIPLRKRQVDARTYAMCHLPICEVFGVSLGAIILLANPSLAPGFLEKSCTVTADNAYIVMWTVLIGCCGATVLFPFFTSIPSRLKDSGRIISASIIQMTAVVLLGVWTMICCPYISYVTLGQRSCNEIQL
eukprot:149535_1